MTGLIGKGAKPKEAKKEYADAYERLAYSTRLFQLAQDVANEDRPLLNNNHRLNTINQSAMITVYTVSDVSMSDSHKLVLAVGRPETGFYQVPIIKLIGGKGKDGVDVIVSGTIDDKAKPESFEKPKKLTEMSKELYDEADMENANRVYAVALVPKSEVLGEEVVVGGIGGKGLMGQSVYHMIVNGFALKRRVVGSAGYEASYLRRPNKFVPVMYPDKEGKERFLKLSDILKQKEVRKLERKGIFPGLTFVAGDFREYRPEPQPLGVLAFHDEVRAPVTLGAGMRGLTKGVGRVGLEEGSESDIKYGSIQGNITTIDGVLALHFLGIEEGTNPDQIKAEIEKLVPK